MKNQTRVSAAILTVLMVLSMLSGMVFTASAEMGSGLGSPVTIEESSATMGGAALPNGYKVVNDDWTEETGWVRIKLDGQLYKAYMGVQAFAQVGTAVSSATRHDVIYVAPGNYNSAVTFTSSNITLYGPNAGVNPNVPTADIATNLKEANPERLGAAALNSSTDNPDLAGEAVFRKTITMAQSIEMITIDGFYMADAAAFTVTGNGQLRNGLYFRNNIYNTTSTSTFGITTDGRAYAGNVVISDCRVLAGSNFFTIGAGVDTKIINNYINVTGTIATLNSASNGSIGDTFLIEGNHIASGKILLSDADLSGYNAQACLFGATISNNYVADCVADMVRVRFDGQWTMPGTNINIIGNTFMGIDADAIPFVFRYREFFGNSVTFRHFINMNENYFDLPANAVLLSNDVDGVLNMSKNFYVNGITADQIQVDKQVSNTNVVLYPYYKDAAMTQLDQGACRVEAIKGFDAKKYTIDNDAKVVTLDLTGLNADVLDLEAALEVSAGDVWSVFKEKTLKTELDGAKLYLDGSTTYRYILIEPADDGLGVLYTLKITREAGTKAELLDVEFNNNVNAPAVSGTTWTYALDSDQQFLDYDLMVSAGATYALYSDKACTAALADLGGYIPYGGYTVYAKVTSQDTKASNVYTIVFNRAAGNQDPTILAASTDAGDVLLRNDINWMAAYMNKFVTSATFNLVPTAGASYIIYKGTTEVSSSANVRALTLTSGSNEFTVKVTDAKGKTNVLDFVVENVVVSSDATIVNIPEYSVGISNNVIEFGTGSATSIFSFTTRNVFATCRVYADEALKYEMKYTASTEIDAATGRTYEKRSFSVPTDLQTNIYYVVCTAEDGVTKQTYKIVATRTLVAKDFDDLNDLNAWYADYVLEASEKGLMAGADNGNGEYVFRPTEKITRQEMAVAVCRLMGINAKNFTETTLPYGDAANIAADWALDSVKACYANGYMKGNEKNNFAPTAYITRQEVMVLFARLFELNGTCDLNNTFVDGYTVPTWSRSGVEAAVAAGLVSGDNFGRLNPANHITRAEIAKLCVEAAK